MPRAGKGLRLRTRAEFFRHVAQFAAFAAGGLVVMLGAGTLGYRHFGGLGWIDALLNAAMILTGMGPVNPMPDDAAKLFAAAYALVSGAVYPALAAVVFYPFVHRMLNILHVESFEAHRKSRAGSDGGGDDLLP